VFVVYILVIFVELMVVVISVLLIIPEVLVFAMVMRALLIELLDVPVHGVFGEHGLEVPTICKRLHHFGVELQVLPQKRLEHLHEVFIVLLEEGLPLLLVDARIKTHPWTTNMM